MNGTGARAIFDFGDDSGAALTVKLAGNFLIVSAIAALNEALSTANAEGVDQGMLLDMLTSTLFPSPIYKAYGQMIVDGHPAAINAPISGKDVALYQGVAKKAGIRTPLMTALASAQRELSEQ